MSIFYFCGLVAIVVTIMIFKTFGKEVVKICRYEEEDQKLNHEDLVLHDLTACDED